MATIPILLGETDLPSARALPQSIAALSERQAARLRHNSWNIDFAQLVARLRQCGMVQVATPLPPLAGSPYPACQEVHRPLEIDDLRMALQKCPEWEHVIEGEKQYIRRQYQFHSFEDAVHFMLCASRIISKLNHHPEWRNTYRMVETWISTFDAGHKLTAIDFDVAQAIDDIYLVYKS